MSYKPWVVAISVWVPSQPRSPLQLCASPGGPADKPGESKHLLSEALPDVLSQQQAFGSLVPLPSPVPRRRSPELDQGPRLYPELRGPLEGVALWPQ